MLYWIKIAFIIVIVVAIIIGFIFWMRALEARVKENFEKWIRKNIIDFLSKYGNIPKEELEKSLLGKDGDTSQKIKEVLKESKIIFQRRTKKEIEARNIIELNSGTKAEYRMSLSWDELPSEIREKFILSDTDTVEIYWDI